MAIQLDLKTLKNQKDDDDEAEKELGGRLLNDELWIQEGGISALRGGGVSKEPSLSGARCRWGISRGRHTCSKRLKLLFFSGQPLEEEEVRGRDCQTRDESMCGGGRRR